MILTSLLALVTAAQPAPAASPSPAAPSPTVAVLRVGMETRQPPWSFVPGQRYDGIDFRQDPGPLTPAQAKGFTGLDVDVMNALGRQMGMTVKLVPTAWFSTESNLLAGKFDIILSSWTPNPRTPADVVATAPYFDWGLLIAARADDTAIHGFGDLEGKRVGHYRDPAVERSLQAMGHGAFIPADDPEQLFVDLKAKKLDAVIFDSPYVRWKAAGDKELRVVGEPLNKLGYHIGVRRQDTALLARVQAAIKALRDSGEIEKIRKRWEAPDAPR